jgi:hypothetical protein
MQGDVAGSVLGLGLVAFALLLAGRTATCYRRGYILMVTGRRVYRDKSPADLLDLVRGRP